MASYTFVSCIDSRVENLTKFYGRFQLGPFAPGQALTVANALRRALLSQLSGISITLLEIQGASSEYEVLSGVRESVLDILLNIKQIVLTSDFESMNPQVGFLAVKGPGIVRAGDLKLPAFIYAVDPNQYIATLSNSGRLNLKFLICSGKNSITYIPSDSQYKTWLLLLQQAKPFKHSDNVPEKKFEKNLEDPLVLNFETNTTHFYTDWLMERDRLMEKSLLQKKTLFSALEINHALKTEGGNSRINPKLALNSQTVAKGLEFVRSKKDFKKASILSISHSQKIEKEGKKYLENFRERPSTEQEFDSTNGVTNLAKPEIQAQNSSQKTKKGVFPIDAFFMPVIRANYLIESHDFLEIKQNFSRPKERIIFEIWTNGSLHPRQAIHKASKSLIQLFLPLQQMRTTFFQPVSTSLNLKSHAQKKPKKSLSRRMASVDSASSLFSPLSNSSGALLDKDNEKQQLQKTRLKKSKITSNKKFKNQESVQILSLDIGNFDLTPRCYSCLKMANIHTLQDLISYSKKDLFKIKNFAQRFLVEIESVLQKLQLNLN